MKTNRFIVISASLIVTTARLCIPLSAAPAEKTSRQGDFSTNSSDMAACQRQLNMIYGALQEYQKRNQTLPEWLSNLTPDFIHDPDVLVCPYVRKTGNVKKWKAALIDRVFRDASSTYAYELCTLEIPTVPPITCRDYKQRQLGLVGFSVPMVRCFAHRPILNLAFDGNIYESPREWEDNFERSPAGKSLLHGIPRKIDDRTHNESILKVIPPPSSQAGAGIVDLSKQYNALLLHLSQMDHAGKLLITHPEGLQKIEGVVFDIRGLVHLTATNFPIPFPRRVADIGVRQKCAQIHFLHGAMFSAPPGSRIASYIVHYTDGRTNEVSIVYGKDLKTRWFDARQPAELDNPKVAWVSPPDRIGDAGRSLRLYHTTWKNDAPDSEVKSIDFVSHLTPAAPFLVAISVE